MRSLPTRAGVSLAVVLLLTCAARAANPAPLTADPAEEHLASIAASLDRLVQLMEQQTRAASHQQELEKVSIAASILDVRAARVRSLEQALGAVQEDLDNLGTGIEAVEQHLLRMEDANPEHEGAAKEIREQLQAEMAVLKNRQWRLSQKESQLDTQLMAARQDMGELEKWIDDWLLKLP